MMQLYYAGTSPFVRKVTVLALETGQSAKLERVATNPWSDEDPLPGTNPVGRIPALRLDDGTVLSGSQLICEYLDLLHIGTKLFPPAGPARWQALNQQYLADGAMEAGVASVVERLRRPAQYAWPDWVARQKKKVERTLDSFEAMAKQGELSGPITIGTLTIAIALGYIDFRMPDLEWRKTRPALAAWEAVMAERPSLAQTKPA